VFKLAYYAAGAFASNANDQEKVQYNINKNTDLELFVLPMLDTFWHRRFGTINVFPWLLSMPLVTRTMIMKL
jgi:hypothetical protein